MNKILKAEKGEYAGADPGRKRKRQIQSLNCMLTPAKYIGLAEEEVYFDFAERFTSLKGEFEEQLKEGKA